MRNINEFKGKTEEAVDTLKDKVVNIEKKVESMDRRIWLILLLVTVTLAQNQDMVGSLVGKVLAFGR